MVVYNVGVIELRAQILPEGGQIFLPQPVALDGFFFGESLGFRLVGNSFSLIGIVKFRC